MNYIILYQEGYVNLIKHNLTFEMVGEYWQIRITDKELYEFLNVNGLTVNHQRQIVDLASPANNNDATAWGVLSSTPLNSTLLNLPQVKRGSLKKKWNN